MMPMALAVLARRRDRAGPYGRLRRRAAMGIAFAASIGGLRHPRRLADQRHRRRASSRRRPASGSISCTWTLYGMPLVLLGVPLAGADHDEGPEGRRRPTSTPPRRAPGIGDAGAWSTGPRSGSCRWSRSPSLPGSPCRFVDAAVCPKDSLTDGTIAVVVGAAAVRHARRHRPARCSTGTRPTARRGA